MGKNWSGMTSEERRARRFERWLAADGVEFESPVARQRYERKLTRYIKAIMLEVPDRVPVLAQPGFGPAGYSGYTIKDAMYDSGKVEEAWVKYASEIDMDFLPGSPSRCGKAWDIMDNKTYMWPGHGLSDNMSPQFVEEEYMREGEWTEYMKDPSDYHLRKFLPRINGTAAPLATLPPLRSLGERAAGADAFLKPEIQAVFKAMSEAGKANAEWAEDMNNLENRLKGMGLPSYGTLTLGGAPLDSVGAYFRGTKGTIIDMYRHADIIHEYMDKTVPESIANAISLADRVNNPVMMMPMHRGADGFMSEEQFLSFYWPYLKRVMLGQVEAGLVPLCFAEGGYNTRLEIIKDFPKGKAIWYFDNTDMKKAKEVLGDTYCLMGNVPTSLMVTGTPEQVKDYCRKLIEDVAGGGGFVLSPGATSDDAKAENIQAMMDAAKEYGVYS